MKNGCLSDYLKKNKDKPLSWLKRLNICLDVARGLQYLHAETDEFGKGIIHRDMKPGNILVGENWVGKVSDFGMFKLSNAGQEKSTMATDRKGTSGFFAPEYVSLGRVTRKIDVFSFGVVLFKVLCEKMPWDREDESYYFADDDDLGDWARKNVVAQIRRQMSGDSLTLFTYIIGRCLQKRPGKRPTMNEVVRDLQKVLEIQPIQVGDSEEPTMVDVVLESQESENQPKQLMYSPRCLQFSLEEISAGTNNFDNSNIMDKGKGVTVYFAEVYIGKNKTLVALKRFKREFREFEMEISIFSKIQHPNLVSLIGYCNESGEKIIVHEYMAKGSLLNYLEKDSHIAFSWLERLNVCLGVARGLQCLHFAETDEFPKGIIHRDVNPSNILVGENFVGKLSGFGIFQEKSGMTLYPEGKSGYHATEYVMLGRVTRKIDIYSFGVVLFQVLCRKLPWDREDDSYKYDEDEDLGMWAQENIDTNMEGTLSGESITLFTNIIGKSLQKKPGKRPNIDDVVLDIQKAIECQAKHLEDKDAEKE